MRLIHITLIIFTLAIASCSRNPTDPPNPNPPGSANIEGVLYTRAIDGALIAFDLKTEQVLWHKSDHNHFDIPLTYHNGTIYYNGLMYVEAIDAATGQLKWRSQIGGSYSNRVLHMARVVVRDTLVYAISNTGGFDESATLYCLRASTGEIRWEKKMNPHDQPDELYGTPLLIGDKVFATALRHGSPRNIVWCFDRITGDVKWSKDTIENVLNPNPFTLDSTDVQFVAGANGANVIALDINTGNTKWTSAGFGATGSTLGSKPSYHNNKLVVYSAAGNQVAYMNAGGGAFQNTVTLEFRNNTTDHQNRVFYMDYNYHIGAVDMNTKLFTWEKDMPGKKYKDSSFASSQPSHVSAMTSTESYVCYYELVRDFPRLLISSLYFHDSQSGELLKEIKFTENTFGLGVNLLIVKDGKSYYAN